MKMLLLSLILLSSTSSQQATKQVTLNNNVYTVSQSDLIGIATSNHYIDFNDSTGYYVEEDDLIKTGDVVLITKDDEIYIIDTIKTSIRYNHQVTR